MNIVSLIFEGEADHREPRIRLHVGANRDVGVEKEAPSVGLIKQLHNTHERTQVWRQHDIDAPRSGESPVLIDEKIAENAVADVGRMENIGSAQANIGLDRAEL